MYRKEQLQSKLVSSCFSSLDQNYSMDFKSKLVDVSYFFHLEATGDSESGFFDPAITAINHALDDDGAESCSCDTTSDHHVVIELSYSLDIKAHVYDEDEEDGEVVEQNKVHLYRKPSAVSVDSTKTMDEMEKNRIFGKPA